MYQGGWDLRGKLSYFNETLATQHYNDMPYINYDFQAPSGACGQERPQYNLLRQQAMVLHDFGKELGLMPAIMSAKRSYGEAKAINGNRKTAQHTLWLMHSGCRV